MKLEVTSKSEITIGEATFPCVASVDLSEDCIILGEVSDLGIRNDGTWEMDVRVNCIMYGLWGLDAKADSQ